MFDHVKTVLGEALQKLKALEENDTLFYVDPVADWVLGSQAVDHINAVGADNLDVRVVLHGNGLSLLLKPDALKNVPKFKAANSTTAMQQKVDSLKMQGVHFNVCANTVKGRKVDIKHDLYDVGNKDVVPSGVAELAHLQQQGFVYLRP